MKKKFKKLTLNKSIISNLEQKAQNKIMGGISHRGCHSHACAGPTDNPCDTIFATCICTELLCSVTCDHTCGYTC